MYNGLGTAVDLAPDDPILFGEGSGECSPFDDMFFQCDYQQAPVASGYKVPIGPQPPSKPGVSAWLKQNSGAVYLGTGVLVLMAMFGKKGR